MDNNRRPSHKFTCYFCNKTIENESEVGHTAVCGNVLVACPNKCGAYVPRMDMKKHKRECVNRTTRSSPRLPTLIEYDSGYDPPNLSTSLGRNMNGLVKQDYQLSLKEDIKTLSKKITDVERKFLQNQQNIPNLIHNFETLKNNNMQQSVDVEKLKYQNKTMFDWKSNIDMQLGSIKQGASYLQNSKKETDMIFMTLQDRIILLEKMQIEVNLLKDSFQKEAGYNRQAYSNFEQGFNDLKSLLGQENAATTAILNDHKCSMDALERGVEEIKKVLEEQKAKLTNIVFDLRAASQIASEAAEKLEIQERDFAATKKEIHQIRLDLEILEGLSSSSDCHMRPGRLIWKIDDFETKLLRAREFNSVMKSPVFYTHEYGYKVRILMYLNGLKKWKDRYVLLCIHVLKGEYDMLLRWPCHIEGNIILRDLEDVEKGKPFSKYITAKRQCGDEESEEPQESSSTYIFIPHSTLQKSNYLKNDTIFLEFKIQKSAKLETNL